jgi:hypothetical protein
VDVLEKRPHSLALFSRFVEYAFGFLLGPAWGLDGALDFALVDFALVDFALVDFAPVDFVPDELFVEAGFAGCLIGRAGVEGFAPIDVDLAKIILLTKKGNE